MSKSEQAISCFRSGLNCAQATLLPFAEDLGLDKETALRMAAAFGRGLRCGEICGAAAGAAMVMGLKYGQRTEDDNEAKADCYARIEAFMEAFRIENGSLLCRDILVGASPRLRCEKAVAFAANAIEQA